ncbi:MAG: transketolase, partial [SAR324 cluster bacterium]|nr:transketolase [SAR324 cluster bacterium]
MKTLKPLATRKCSEMFLDIISNSKLLIGGSADLSGSNNTMTKNHKIIKPGEFMGNYIHYGVREHGMAAIMNGIAATKIYKTYSGTFLSFADYMKP